MLFSELSFAAANWKFIASGVALAGLVIAEANVPPQTTEDYTLQGLLVLTVGYLARLLLKQQDEHKADREAAARQHQEEAHAREEKMLAAITAQTEQLKELTTLTREQAKYHKAVTRGIIADRLGKPPLP